MLQVKCFKLLYKNSTLLLRNCQEHDELSVGLSHRKYQSKDDNLVFLLIKDFALPIFLIAGHHYAMGKTTVL